METLKRSLIAILICFVPVATFVPVGAQTPSASPAALEGLPATYESATVIKHNDGDKFRVRIEQTGEEHEINLIGTDAPEPGECFAGDAKTAVKELVPLKATVYLERDKLDTDKKDRLLRYVWLPDKTGAKAYLLNSKLIRDGFAGWVSKDGNTKYDRRLKKAQEDAQEKKNGLWAECTGVHGERIKSPTRTPEPKPEPEPTEESTINCADGFASGGVGLSIADFEAKFGPDEGPPTEGISTPFRYYQNRTIMIMTLSNCVWNLSVEFPEGVDTASAEAIALQYLPADVVFIEQYPHSASPLGSDYVIHYNSASLAAQMGPDMFWTNGNPGDLIVIFSRYTGTDVDDILIGMGNNP